MKSASTKPLTKALLALISELGESAIDFYKLWTAIATRYSSAYGRGGRGYAAELKGIHSQVELKRKLSELKRRKYIGIYHTGKKFKVALTNKGRSYNKARSWRKSLPNKIGWFTVVVFDIPEQMSNERRQWRTLLKIGGFKKLQKSVWVSELDSYDLVTNFIKEIKISKWVNVFRATDFLVLPK